MTLPKIQIGEQDRNEFQANGYWISPKLIDDERIAKLRKAVYRLMESEYDGDARPMNALPVIHDANKLRKFNNGWWFNQEIAAMVRDPLLGELAAGLLETNEIRLWHDQVIVKPGTGGEETKLGNVGWHQDYGYWQCSNNSNMITAWIALQDTDLTNGGMMSILGSHKWGLIPDSDSFFNQDMEQLRQKYETEGKVWKEDPCILKAGQASFHHALTFHGSGVNFTNEPRLSIVAHFMPGGTAYRAGVQKHFNVSLLGADAKEGRLYENEFFPVTYRKERKEA